MAFRYSNNNIQTYLIIIDMVLSGLEYIYPGHYFKNKQRLKFYVVVFFYIGRSSSFNESAGTFW